MQRNSGGITKNVERAAFRLPAPAVFSDCNAAFTVAVRTRILAALTQFPCIEALRRILSYAAGRGLQGDVVYLADQ